MASLLPFFFFFFFFFLFIFIFCLQLGTFVEPDFLSGWAGSAGLGVGRYYENALHSFTMTGRNLKN